RGAVRRGGWRRTGRLYSPLWARRDAVPGRGGGACYRVRGLRRVHGALRLELLSPSVLVASGIRRGTVERRRAGGPVRLTCGRPGPGEGGDRGGRRSGDGRRRGLRPLRAVRRCGHRQARGTVSRARPPVLFRAQAGVGFGTDVGRG